MVGGLRAVVMCFRFRFQWFPRCVGRNLSYPMSTANGHHLIQEPVPYQPGTAVIMYTCTGISVGPSGRLITYSTRGRRVEYCDERVCVFQRAYFGQYSTVFSNFSACYHWPWVGPLLAALRYVMYFRFHIYIVMYKNHYGQQQILSHRGRLQSLTTARAIDFCI